LKTKINLLKRIIEKIKKTNQENKAKIARAYDKSA